MELRKSKFSIIEIKLCRCALAECLGYTLCVCVLVCVFVSVRLCACVSLWVFVRSPKGIITIYAKSIYNNQLNQL